jgi:hypothetical protein
MNTQPDIQVNMMYTNELGSRNETVRSHGIVSPVVINLHVLW